MLKTLSQIGHRLISLFDQSTLTDGQAIQDMSSLVDARALSKYLFYEAFDEVNEIFINTSSIGFVLEMSPLIGGDLATLKILESFFQDFSEEGTSLQFLLWADHRIDPFLNWWEASPHGKDIYSTISKKRSQFFKENLSLKTRNFRVLISFSKTKTNDLYRDIAQTAKVKAKLIQSLKALAIVWNWRPLDLIETVGTLTNLSLSTKWNKRTYNPFQLLSDQISLGGGLKISDDFLTLNSGEGEVICKNFRVIDTPTQWSAFSMSNLIGDLFRDSYRINGPFYIHYGVNYPNQNKEESSFKQKQQLIENQGKSNHLLRMIPRLERELKECDFIRRALNQGAKFVWTQLSAGIWSSKEFVEEAEQSLKNLFNINGFKLAENTYIQLPHHLSILPMTWSEYVNDLKQFAVLKTTLSTECANFVPLQGEWSGTSTQGMLLVQRRGQLLNWNPFDGKGNYNCSVLGGSGAGKSVFMQDLLMSGLRNGAKVFVLDVGRSFEKMCDLTGGQFIEFSSHTKICLNPFSKLKVETQEDRETAFSFLKSIISCMASPLRGTDEIENPLIEEAIAEVWDVKKNTATVTDIAHWLANKKNQIANNLAIMLTSYTAKGVYAKYFEGENNCNFSNQLVVIELEELKNKKDLQAVVLQLFIMTIANDVFLGDRKTPVYLCIDEAWELLRAPQTASFIETLARRLRKYNGSLITGTQNIRDFFAVEGAKAAYANSDWTCYLRMKKDEIQTIVKNSQIDIDERMQRALESLVKIDNEYSEVMICDGNGNYSIARLILDPFSQMLYSTKPSEYTEVKSLTQQGLSVEQAIDVIIGKRNE